MSRFLRRVPALVTLAALAACSSNGASALPPQAAFTKATTPSGRGIAGADVAPAAGPWVLQPLCARTANVLERRCEAIRRLDLVNAKRPGGAPPGYSPADLQSAYGLTAASAGAGAGQTVAIVDAYNDPKAESDLAIYRATYGLPACTTANGCFRKVNQYGHPSPLPKSDPGWGGEESLDLDMVSAICPKCHIVFVEASNAGGGLDLGVKTAVRLGARYVSNSYGGAEYERVDPAFVHQGVVFTASAGDADYYDCDPGGASSSYPSTICTGPEQPASFGTVVAAGGTTLVRDASTARGWSESVWNDVITASNDYGGTGSGCSKLVPKPSWQTDHGCPNRSETDVSAVADPNTPVAVYDSFGAGGWNAFGGTSVSSPLLAAVFALGGNAATVAQPAGIWHGAGAGLNDITVGNNLVPRSVYGAAVACPAKWAYICYAGPGYDGPTGWGTPSGTAAF